MVRRYIVKHEEYIYFVTTSFLKLYIIIMCGGNPEFNKGMFKNPMRKWRKRRKKLMKISIFISQLMSSKKMFSMRLMACV